MCRTDARTAIYHLDKGNPSALKFQKNDRSAIVYNGLVIGVQSRHPIRDRPASLEAESLARVYNNEEWCELLEKHGIDPEPKSVISVSLKSSSYRNQAPPKPSYFVERPEVSIELKKLLLSSETAETGTLVRYISFH